MLAVLCLCASAAAFTPVAISAQLAQHGGDTVDCVLDGHTRLCLRRSFSKRDVPTGRRVPVLSLTNIAVDSPFAGRVMHAVLCAPCQSTLQPIAALSSSRTSFPTICMG